MQRCNIGADIYRRAEYNRKTTPIIAACHTAPRPLALLGVPYQLNKKVIGEVMRRLMGNGAFWLEENQVVWSALMDDEAAMLDFFDALIIHKARFVTDQKGQAHEGFYSFGKGLGPLKGIVPLTFKGCSGPGRSLST